MSTRSEPGSSAPVRWVRFAVYFSTDLPPLAADIAEFVRHFRASFPVVTEDPPLGGFQKDGPAVAFLGRGAAWPLPFTQMENPELGTKLFFQGDRVGVSWQFEPTDSSMQYPGFDELSKVVLDSMGRFSEALLASGCFIEVEGAECRYVNLLPDVSARDYVVSRLGGTPGASEEGQAGQADDFSFETHFHEGDDDPIWVEVAPEADGTELTIVTRCESDSEDGLNDVESASTLLSRAHDYATKAFETWGSLPVNREGKSE